MKKMKKIIIVLSFFIATISNINAQSEENSSSLSFEEGTILVINEVNFSKLLDYQKSDSEPKRALKSEYKSPTEFNIYKISQNEYSLLAVFVP